MNSRLDELQAAIMRSALLPRLARRGERRRSIGARYRALLHHPALTLPAVPAGSQSVCHLSPVLVQGDRSAFAAHLDARGMGHAVHYPKLIPEQEALGAVLFESRDDSTKACRFAECELSLPIHPYMTDDDVERVVAACNEWNP